MQKVNADPEKLKNFAKYLTMRSNELKEKIKKLKIDFNNLSEEWKDPVHERFKNELLQSTKSLEQFINISTETSQHLIKKAEILERYLNIR
jgi:uncharacterized protein YukE